MNTNQLSSGRKIEQVVCYATIVLNLIVQATLTPAQADDPAAPQFATSAQDPTRDSAVSGPDSTLFVYYDPDSGQRNLGRRELALGDKSSGSFLAAGILGDRPSVTGDGKVALFLNADDDLCLVGTSDPNTRQCLGLSGDLYSVYSAAISPDGRLATCVFRDLQKRPPQIVNSIILINFAEKKTYELQLAAPTADETMLHADVMSFSNDGADLIYDVLSEAKAGTGPAVRRWSIYSVHLATGQTSALVPPQDGVDSANPTIGPLSNRYLAYDSQDAATGVTHVMVLDMLTGQKATVGTLTNGFGFPSFLGDERGLIYAVPDPNATVSGYSLVKQALSEDRLHTEGTPTLWHLDAELGVIYQRATPPPTNAPPTVTLQLSADQIPAGGSATLTAAATDSDGTIARVEFYEGSTKLGSVATPPFVFTWQNVPAGNHLLLARAFDNLGAAKDSSPKLVTAAGSSGGNNKAPSVSLQLSSDQISTQETVTLTATATDPDGTIARVVFYDGSTRLAQVDAAPYKFLWTNVAPGNHLLTAHAVDNAGAETVSSPKLITVSGVPAPKDQPKLSIRPISPGTVRVTVTGPPGYYYISMSEDLKSWADIYGVIIEPTGNGTGYIDDAGGPMHYSHLFYRARPD
jgi:hypothetical protein